MEDRRRTRLGSLREWNPDTGQDFVDAGVLFDTHLRRVLPADDDAFFTLVDGDGFLFSFDPPATLLDDPDLVASWGDVTTSSFSTVDTEAAGSGPAVDDQPPMMLRSPSASSASRVAKSPWISSSRAPSCSSI